MRGHTIFDVPRYENKASYRYNLKLHLATLGFASHTNDKAGDMQPYWLAKILPISIR